jgi:hypothetical protein
MAKTANNGDHAARERKRGGVQENGTPLLRVVSILHQNRNKSVVENTPTPGYTPW